MPSAWLLAAVVLIPALQVPAVWYLSRYVELEDGELSRLPTGYSFAEDDAERHPDAPKALPGQGPTDPQHLLQCDACGAANDRTYRYCQECAGLL